MIYPHDDPSQVECLRAQLLRRAFVRPRRRELDLSRGRVPGGGVGPLGQARGTDWRRGRRHRDSFGLYLVLREAAARDKDEWASQTGGESVGGRYLRFNANDSWGVAALRMGSISRATPPRPRPLSPERLLPPHYCFCIAVYG